MFDAGKFQKFTMAAINAVFLYKKLTNVFIIEYIVLFTSKHKLLMQQKSNMTPSSDKTMF